MLLKLKKKKKKKSWAEKKNILLFMPVGVWGHHFCIELRAVKTCLGCLHVRLHDGCEAQHCRVLAYAYSFDD